MPPDMDSNERPMLQDAGALDECTGGRGDSRYLSAGLRRLDAGL